MTRGKLVCASDERVEITSAAGEVKSIPVCVKIDFMYRYEESWKSLRIVIITSFDAENKSLFSDSYCKFISMYTNVSLDVVKRWLARGQNTSVHV